jgi:prefoldin subunit 5
MKQLTTEEEEALREALEKAWERLGLRAEEVEEITKKLNAAIRRMTRGMKEILNLLSKELFEVDKTKKPGGAGE